MTQEETRQADEQLQGFRERQLNSTSHYTPVGPLSLLNKANEFYEDYGLAIYKTLIAKGVTTDTIKVVLQDYLSVLVCGGVFTASIGQMREALRALQPNDVCITDRFGLYFGLLSSYARILEMYDKYVTQVKNGTPTQKNTFFYKLLSAPSAKAFIQLLPFGCVSIDDLKDVDLPQAYRFLDNCTKSAGLCDFAIYYCVAKNTLSATPEELAEITQPPFVTGFNAVEFAEYIDSQKNGFCFEHFEQAELNTPEPEPIPEPEPEQLNLFTERDVFTQDDTATVETVKPTTETNITPIRLPERVGLILGRPVNIAPDKNNTADILPIQMYIDNFMSKNDGYKGITPRVVDKAIEGVNMLQRWQNVAPVNGQYVYQVNISQFALLCGFADANQDEKQQLLGALLLLHNLYVVVWEPKGRTAVQVLNVQKIGIDTGDLEIRVPTDVMKGKPNFIDYKTFEAMRKTAKGEAQNRFRYQIMSKGQKTETALLNEVFGYDDKILEATHGTGDETAFAEEVKNVRTYIKNHKSDDKKRLKGWFDIYQNKLKVITYTSYKNGANELVYKWDRVRPALPEQEPPKQLP